jgi:hypothetical protein
MNQSKAEQMTKASNQIKQKQLADL